MRESWLNTTSFQRTFGSILVGALGSALFVGATWLYKVVPLPIAVSVAATFLCTTSFFLILRQTKSGRIGRQALQLGITGLWRNEQDFQRHQGMSYTECCRRMIQETPDGQEVVILGYDWVEVFPDTSVLADDILRQTGVSRLRFRVVLVDPQGSAPLEKRAWEMLWCDGSGEPLYPEGSSPESLGRLVSKIQACVDVAAIFQRERPQYFDLKLTPVPPSFSMLMTETWAIGVLYSLPHKGKDTVIFRARPRKNKAIHRVSTASRRISSVYGDGFYGFLKGYFESVWKDPNWRCSQLVPADNGGLSPERSFRSKSDSAPGK